MGRISNTVSEVFIYRNLTSDHIVRLPGWLTQLCPLDESKRIDSVSKRRHVLVDVNVLVDVIITFVWMSRPRTSVQWPDKVKMASLQVHECSTHVVSPSTNLAQISHRWCCLHSVRMTSSWYQYIYSTAWIIGCTCITYVLALRLLSQFANRVMYSVHSLARMRHFNSARNAPTPA